MAAPEGPDSRASEATRFEDTQRGGASSACAAENVCVLSELRVAFLRFHPTRRTADSSPGLRAVPTWGKEAGSGRKTSLPAGTAGTAGTTL